MTDAIDNQPPADTPNLPVDSVNADFTSRPLPLVPFEDYMLVDDRPTHPMTFFLRLHFRGLCDRAKFDTAMRHAVARHPLLSARIESGKRNHFVWIARAECACRVEWKSSETASDEFGCLDVTRRSGLRIVGEENYDGVSLAFQFHHACCDAIGAMQFIEDILLAYDALAKNEQPDSRLSTLDSQILNRRANYGTTRWRLIASAHKQAVGLLGARQFLMRKPVSVLPAKAEQMDSPLLANYPAFRSRTLSLSSSVALREAAKSAGTTVNNLLARDLFLALGQVRERIGVGSEHDWLRLTVPVDMRSPSDEGMPAANLLSMVFLDRRPTDFTAGKEFLSGIHREMKLIKDLNLGLTFLLSLGVTRAMPGALARMQRMSLQPRCRGTCVFSNLVQPLADSRLPLRGEKVTAGEMVLNDIEFLPPVRPFTSAAFGILTYAGQLRISLHFDSRTLPDQEAHQLFDTFVAALETAAG